MPIYGNPILTFMEVLMLIIMVLAALEMAGVL